ncbi:MAG: hypothetical protein KDI15_08945 [Thiothrix sp.]|nr:hypothetical protein [Thiothrix sp.]HPE60933.1 hypothetical protein [Thiolinea sp.]
MNNYKLPLLGILGLMGGCTIGTPYGTYGYIPPANPNVSVPVAAASTPIYTTPPATVVSASVNNASPAVPAARPIPEAPQVLTPPTLSPEVNVAVPSATVPANRSSSTSTNTNTAVTNTTTPVSGNNIPDQKLGWVAEKIYKNEINADENQLVSWNGSENFVSLGIGRFIWYPASKRGTYTETFPALLDYISARGVQMPSWLAAGRSKGSPWADEAAFNAARNDREMLELRQFMKQTLPLQVGFLNQRLQRAIPDMMNQLPAGERERVMKNYQTMTRTQGGIYPVLDYLQFKGEGTNPRERYNGKGWGLMQVLQGMQDVEPGPNALAEFMRSADEVLVTRIANSPADRREARWLTGWQQRLRTYHPTSVAQR